MTYTYSLDAGDGFLGPEACAVLGTTDADAMLPPSALAGSVVYASSGVKTAVLRVFTVNDCPSGSVPTSSNTIVAVGVATIKVRSSPRGFRVQRL